MVKCDSGSENTGGGEEELEERRLWSGVDMGTVCVSQQPCSQRYILFWDGD